MAAPLGSTTVPEIVPLLVCANDSAMLNANTNAKTIEALNRCIGPPTLFFFDW
jgi:hypothetical protein